MAGGRSAVVGRVIGIEGFSTLPVDELIAIDDEGGQFGDLLGRPGAERLKAAASVMFGSGAESLQTVTVEISGREVAEVGLSCGGRADVLLQPVSAIPPELWELFGSRAPAALITRIEGPGAGPGAVVVGRDGQSWGRLEDGEHEALVAQAKGLIASGRSSTRRVDDEAGVVLIEAWVPAPRLVVVGSGEMVGAIQAQGALLGWEVRSTDDSGDVDGLLDWAGATAALIVLSHDPHVDAPALAAGLARAVPYVGAMGSRSTQSRRIQRLEAEGVSEKVLDRIHRPIGLDLGGRRAPEVALAIAAEILSCHCGRDARPLRDRSGPIHDRSS